MISETDKARAAFDAYWNALTPIERLEFERFADEQGWTSDRRQGQRWKFSFYAMWHGQTIAAQIAEMRQNSKFLESLR